MQQPTHTAATPKVPETEGPATERELFFSMTPAARRQALELFFVAAEREDYFNFLGTTPTNVFQVLLAADFTLRNGSPDQKIEIMLQFLKDYDIDVEGLRDAIEAGHAPDRPVNRQ